VADDLHPDAPRAQPAGIAVGGVAIRTLALSAIAASATLLALREAAAVVVPVLVSILLAYALEPIVATLTRWRVPRLVAAVVVYLAVVALVVIGARELRAQTLSLLDELPVAIAATRQALTGNGGAASNPIARLRQALAAAEPARRSPAAPAGVARVTIVDRPFQIRRYVPAVARVALGVGIQTLAVAILTFLLLTTGDLFKKKLVKLSAHAFDDSHGAWELMTRIDRQIQRYLLVRILICAIVAAATGLAIYALGVDNAAALGVAAGALNVVPFIGPTIGVALVTVAAFLQFKTLAMAGAAGGAALVVAAAEGNLISPLLMSRAGELNTVAVFVSVLMWGWVWDVWGLLLAVPIMVVVKAAADHIESLKPVGELLGP
jgi:predicted PurR-regulated permease PerM